MKRLGTSSGRRDANPGLGDKESEREGGREGETEKQRERGIETEAEMGRIITSCESIDACHNS